MSYTKAKTLCSDLEVKRFACCFLNIDNYMTAVNWKEAALQFDPNVKETSFKTFIVRSIKKLGVGSYTKAKAMCSDLELKRFACSFLNCEKYTTAVDWDEAAKQFDPEVKKASFRTFISRSIKKLDAVEGSSAMAKPAAKGKGGGRRKRKVEATEEGGDGEADEEAAGQKGGRKKKMKVEQVEELSETVEAEVKEEPVDEICKETVGTAERTEGVKETAKTNEQADQVDEAGDTTEQIEQAEDEVTESEEDIFF